MVARLCSLTHPNLPVGGRPLPSWLSLVGGSALGVLACHMLTLSPLTANSHLLPVDQ